MHRPTLKFLASDARKAIAAAAAPGQSSMVLIGALAPTFPLCLYVAFKTCNCARCVPTQTLHVWCAQQAGAGRTLC